MLLFFPFFFSPLLFLYCRGSCSLSLSLSPFPSEPLFGAAVVRAKATPVRSCLLKISNARPSLMSSSPMVMCTGPHRFLALLSCEL